MDQIAFAIGALLIAVLIGPWILIWRGRRRRKRDQEENRRTWQELTRRVYDLEQTVGRMASSSGLPASEAKPSPARAVSAGETVLKRVIPAVQATPPEPLPQPRVVPVPEPGIVASVSTIPPSGFPTPEVRVESPQFQSSATPTSLFDRFKSFLNFEEKLGRNWLNKAGIALLVLGVAFLLNYVTQTVGPLGKILLGFAVSAALLFVGIWFERNETYRILARAGIGGGWALLFFTTYAMYHVPAAHVISSQALDLVLMLVIAATMVWHTLRYQSQVVTGLAFLLAFLTVTISHDTVYSLAAGIVLAAGLGTICCRMQWFELEILGILASYLNHYLWLRPIIEPMNGHRKLFPQFAASAGILLGYWLIFRTSYVARSVKNSGQERASTAGALLNTVLLLLLFKYQSAHPEWAFWALVAIGAVEVALSQLSITKRRRNAVIVLSTIGVILLIAAFPFRYSGSRLSLLWLLEAEALLLIGVWTREVVFRRLGMIAALVTTGQMIGVDAAKVAGMRIDGADTHADYGLAVVFAVASIVFYLTSHVVGRRWAELFEPDLDRRGLNWLSYAGALMIVIGAWIAFPQSWTVVAWCMIALGLALGAKQLRLPDLRYQSHFIVAMSLLRIVAVNLEDRSEVGHVSHRVWTFGAVALLLYGTRVLAGADSQWRGWDQITSRAYTWAASLLLGVLAWYELRPVSLAVAWAVLGLTLFELGIERRSLSLRLQAYIGLLAGFGRIFVVNLGAGGSPGEISPRVYTVVPIALAFFYVYWRLQSTSSEVIAPDLRWKVVDLCGYLGTITLAALMRFEVPTDWVGTAWAALAAVLMMIAWRTAERMFLHQALLVTFAVLFRTVLHNLYQRTYFPAPLVDSRVFCVGLTVVLLIAILPLAFRLRKLEPGRTSGLRKLLSAFGRRPEQVFFFIAIALLTALLALDMRHGTVTLSWGLEGVAAFLLALWLGERSFRLTGLSLLLLCVGKIVLVDVWRLNARDRILTLIVMGSALMLVSFLYTRYREMLSQYL